MEFTRLDVGRGPITVHLTIEGTQGRPYTVALLDSKNLHKARVFYEHHKVRKNEISFNLKHVPKNPILFLSRGKLKMYYSSPFRSPRIPYQDEPTVKRNYRLEDIVLMRNYHINGPARMYTNKPVIQHNPHLMNQYSEPTKKFIFLHEVGHHFHNDESKTDAWAAVTFLNDGGNISAAIYALTKVMGRSPENVRRMLEQHELLKEISRRYYGEN